MIKANTGVITQINIFTVPEGGQQALIDLLAESARFASTTPGWISASVHRSCDGIRVVNYAQSESLEAAKRIIERLRDGGWLDRNRHLARRIPVCTRQCLHSNASQSDDMPVRCFEKASNRLLPRRICDETRAPLELRPVSS
jgi:hypothetical protein